MEALTELKDGLHSLLDSRGFACPDGRPLYAYRFARREFDRIGAMLLRHGPAALQDRYGAALIISHVAEWFRRERTGGHWDWIRPLQTIGLDYGPNARIRYRDIESLVSLGLGVWRRPKPQGGERLLAIVREAGFPVASVREDPRISSWLRNSVLCVERGFTTRDAVGAEAWRVSDRLTQALLEPAIELCDKIVELRASLPPLENHSDPVDLLDKMRPYWRDELPFDVECEDIRAMIEQIVRLRDGGAAALDVVRYFVFAGDTWQSRASLGLSGRIDLERLPPSIVGVVRSGRRVRIFPRPPFGDELIAVAAVETFEKDGTTEHELRAFVAKFDTPLGLEDPARLIVQSGGSIVGDFLAMGGEELDSPVIAMQIEQVDEKEFPTRLRVLGSSPVQTSKTTLALAIKEDHFPAVSFSDGFVELGRCVVSERRMVRFSGSATFALDGANWSWTTSAERNADARPVLVGNLLRNVRESVFRGLPRLLVEHEGRLVETRRHKLHWRPRGRGTWRPIEGSKPWGRVDLAVIENGTLCFTIATSIVPPTINLVMDRSNREVRITGLDTRVCAACGATNLVVRFEDDEVIVQLGPPSRTPTIVLRPRWTAELSLTFADPSYDLRMIDGDDTLIPPRSTFSVDRLKGLRILTTREVNLCMELRANDAPRLTITRPISGEAPLSAFAEAITQLLGSSESLDARVGLSVHGASEQLADVRWYAEDVDPFVAPRTNTFLVLETTHGLDLRGIALPSPAAGSIPIATPASPSEMRSELSRSLPRGPWLIYGRRRRGTKIRPRILAAVLEPAAGNETAFELAFGIDSSPARAAAFIEAYAKPDQLSPRDRRTIIDLLAIARREGLPISFIDALKALDRSPRLAVLLLAFCESLDERAAMLDLQRDLPFLWCSTAIDDWLSAFSARIEYVRARLLEVGVDTVLAYRALLADLGEVVSLRPELAGHAKAVVFMRHIAAEAVPENGSVDGAAVHFLDIGRSDHIRREIDRLIGRHDDIDPPPHGLLTPKTRATQQTLYAAYDPSYADVIAVPFALANHASGRIKLTDEELRRCRDVWLYDPEYFEALVPIGIDVILRSFVSSGEGKT
ncbi:STY4851/ECs_5259 family protein [Rhodanobacter sp. Root179]|uniref:STY4851/ECs_5259 family protein n=1 Tax=Rhodanobacter sp. Root179 TaxID=1736482 RepID=UPI0012FACA99|nr:STY4851/ECs_5259 family protein [Rhodanobacter sp. Root179]